MKIWIVQHESGKIIGIYGSQEKAYKIKGDSLYITVMQSYVE